MTDIFTVVVLFTMIWVALGIMTAVHWRAALYALLRCALRHVLRRRRAVAELAVVFPTDTVVVMIEDPCPICCARPLSVKLAPCAHALCAACAARVATCPFCRAILLEAHAAMN